MLEKLFNLIINCSSVNFYDAMTYTHYVRAVDSMGKTAVDNTQTTCNKKAA
ncbi:MAG: hypothetical protein H6Q74_1413 [Firmicutes bacterium]|nr:hypothetical protein [Bacillota bacterium]